MEGKKWFPTRDFTCATWFGLVSWRLNKEERAVRGVGERDERRKKEMKKRKKERKARSCFEKES